MNRQSPPGVRSRLREATLITKGFDLLMLAAAFVVLNWSLLITGDAFALHYLSDLRQLTLPAMTFTGTSLVRGEVPLWNPYMAAGLPNHAMGCAGVFYPTTMLYGIVTFARAYIWDTLAHQALAAIGAYAVAMSLGVRRPIAVLAALAVMRSFPYLESFASLGHIWTVRTLGWTPLALLGLLATMRTCRPPAILGLGLVLGVQILAGDTQIFLCQGYILGAYAASDLLLRLVRRCDTPRQSLNRFAAIAVALCFAIAISAVQWLPTWELMKHSVRSDGVTLDYVRSFAGGPGHSRFATAILYLHWAFPSAVGACLLFLGFCRTSAWNHLPAATAVVVCLILAVWPETAFAHVIHRVPLLGEAREPERILEPLAILLPILCAHVVNAALGLPRLRTKWHSLWWIAAAAVIVPLACWLTDLPLLWCAPLAGATCLVWAMVGWTAPGRTRTGMLLLVCASLVYEIAAQVPANVLAIPNPDREPARADSYRPIPTFQYSLPRDLASFVKGIGPHDRVAVFTSAYYTGEASFGSAIQRRMLASYHAIQPANFVDWFNGMAKHPLIARAHTGELAQDNYGTWANPAWVSPSSLPLLDLMNIRYLLLTDGTLPSNTIKRGARENRFETSHVGEMNIVTNNGALPPVFAVHRTQAADTIESVVAALRGREDFDYRTTALVSSFFDPSQIEAALAPDSIVIEDYRANFVDVVADMSSAGLVIFTDLDYPGWRVSLDGKGSNLVPAYGILKGVVVPAGHHRVRFEFKPQSFSIGYWVSVIALVAVLAILCRSVRRSRSYALSSFGERGTTRLTG